MAVGRISLPVGGFRALRSSCFCTGKSIVLQGTQRLFLEYGLKEYMGKEAGATWAWRICCQLT